MYETVKQNWKFFSDDNLATGFGYGLESFRMSICYISLLILLLVFTALYVQNMCVVSFWIKKYLKDDRNVTKKSWGWKVVLNLIEWQTFFFSFITKLLKSLYRRFAYGYGITTTKEVVGCALISIKRGNWSWLLNNPRFG